MARTHDEIDAAMAEWIAAQPMFFVGSAPLAADGRVNVSPKGPIGTLRVLGPRKVAYLDYAGSGAETIAHLRENGRIVVMLCAFDGPPRIVRLHGTGAVVQADEPEFDELVAEADFAALTEVDEARRSVIVVDVERISSSCGYTVPLMEVVGEREHYDLRKKKRLRTLGSDGLVAYQHANNAQSIDGLPAVRIPSRETG